MNDQTKKKKGNPLNKKLDKLFLQLADCDGMCEHCNEKLKQKCLELKKR